MTTTNKLTYLPENWDNDAEMSGLMSFLKARHINPTNYGIGNENTFQVTKDCCFNSYCIFFSNRTKDCLQLAKERRKLSFQRLSLNQEAMVTRNNISFIDRVVEFWKKVISDYCRHQKKCIFTLDELKVKFKRGSQLPSPLPTVIAELQRSGIVLTKEEIDRQNQGWMRWSVGLLKPNNWLQAFSGADTNIKHFELVHVPTLKEQAKELLLFYRNNYELMIDCPDVVDYNDLQYQTAHIIDEETFPLVINELVRIGEVSIGYSKNGDKVLKFKDQSSEGPARFTETDANVHDIRRAMNRLDADIKKAEQKEQTLKDEAKATLTRKDKKGALNIMRKVARVRKEIQDKDVQYQRLLSMLEQLAASKQSKEIIDVYKQGSIAFKETMNRQGLTPDKVDTTMDSVLETMQDYQDVEEAMREGFKNLPVSGDSVDEAELESELNTLIREEQELEEKTKLREGPIPATDNRVRVGKRVLDLNDLPEVPRGVPSSTASTSALDGNEASLEERWKRLRRMHAI